MSSSYKLPSGQVIPTESESQVRDAIRLAARAHQDVGDGGGWDDPRLRTHLTARARAHGVSHIIPAGWGRDTAGKSAAPGTLMIKMLGNGRVALVKGRQSSHQLPETDAGRAFVKSQQYADLAAQAFDRETREMWLDAARELRKEAGLA
jgi:hypothetical protein